MEKLDIINNRNEISQKEKLNKEKRKREKFDDSLFDTEESLEKKRKENHHHTKMERKKRNVDEVDNDIEKSSSKKQKNDNRKVRERQYQKRFRENTREEEEEKKKRVKKEYIEPHDKIKPKPNKKSTVIKSESQPTIKNPFKVVKKQTYEDIIFICDTDYSFDPALAIIDKMKRMKLIDDLEKKLEDEKLKTYSSSNAADLSNFLRSNKRGVTNALSQLATFQHPQSARGENRPPKINKCSYEAKNGRYDV